MCVFIYMLILHCNIGEEEANSREEGEKSGEREEGRSRAEGEAM